MFCYYRYSIYIGSGGSFMDEFSFIKKITQSTYKQSTLRKGIGDDGAVFRQPTKDIVTVVDTFVENIHFSRTTMGPIDVGYRSLAGTISDLAAMGATPAFYLVSIVVPTSWSKEELLQIFSGMKEIASKHKLDLIGGDTVSGKELCISITALGYVPKNKARYRNTARDNDVVFVTGTLGDSRAGLHILTNDNSYHDRLYYINKHRRPSPQINFAKGLRLIPRVTLNDISDGLANEAAEIATASRVNIVIKDHQLPISKFYKQFPSELQHKWKYFGGEDYELLGTVSKSEWSMVKKIAKDTGTEVTKIGDVEYNNTEYGQVFVRDGQRKRLLQKEGYTHF